MIEVCGFIAVSDVGSPMAVSRHLILPAPINSKENNGPVKQEAAGHEDETCDEGTTPSFCVLLHGALKIEDMAALVTLGENWFVLHNNNCYANHCIQSFHRKTQLTINHVLFLLRIDAT